jgi:ammonium transporter, Amt family
MPEWLFSAVTVAGVIIFLGPGLAILFGGLPDRTGVMLLAIGSPATFVIALAEWAALGAPIEFALIQAATSAAVIASLLGIGVHDARLRGLITVAALWLVVVLVPVAFVTFDVVDGWIYVTLGTIDYGGACQLGLCLGVMGLVLAILVRRRSTPALSISVQGAVRRSRRSFVIATALGLVGWIALSAGAELAIDQTTVPVLTNTLAGAIAGAIGWSIAEAIRVHRVGLTQIVSGMTAGVLVTLPTSPWLMPVAAATLAILAGILGSLTLAVLRRAGFGEWSSIPAICLVPALFGMLATGLVENGIGFIYAGQPGIFLNQLSGSALVLGYAAIVTVAIVIVVDRTVGLFKREAREVSSVVPNEG